MKKLLGWTTGACLALSIIGSLLALGAQECAAQGKAKKQPPLSKADEKAIVELFKGVDASKYRLRFNKGEVVHGKSKVAMKDLVQIAKNRDPKVVANWIVFIVEGDDVIYILAAGRERLEDVLGKEKSEKLNKIMAKYAR